MLKGDFPISKKFLLLIILSVKICIGDFAYSKGILDSSKEINRYEKKVLRYIMKHEKMDYSKVDHLNIFFCNYIGELKADSFLNNSFLSNIEMCFGVFPRNHMLSGTTRFYSDKDDTILLYSHWGKKQSISHLNPEARHSDIKLMDICKDLKIHYCINLCRKNAVFWFVILVDDNNNCYYYDTKEECCFMLNEKVDEIIETFSDGK